MPHSKERFLAPGEQITLWVELELPETVEHDIFQVSKLVSSQAFAQKMLADRLQTYGQFAPLPG